MPIIFGKKHKCPDCGAIAFGCLHIEQAWGGQNYLELACEKCGTTYRCDLPKLEKEVLYLDQHAISLMMRSQETGKNGQWSNLFDRLKSMVQWQRIICPISWAHRQESELSASRYTRLMETGRALAMGNRLRASQDIQYGQIYRALDAFSRRADVEWAFESKEAFDRDPSAWHDHFAVDVDFGRQPEQIADRRNNKEAIQKRMEVLYADPDYLNRSFEEHVQLETEGFAHGLLGAFDQVVQRVLLTIKQESRGDDSSGEAREFFFSPQFAGVPVVYINAVLRAAMALKARDSGRKPKSSDQCDLEILSAYMPYCDAMLIDGEMRSLATDGKASLNRDYGTKLFSGKTLPKLNEWLDEVEATFPASQKEAIINVYEERFDKLKLRKGRNLLEARRALMTERPTPRPQADRSRGPCEEKGGRDGEDG